ncbi:MAG: aspartate-semialdehyde dehydrogenase [Anaerolineales bacterium]
MKPIRVGVLGATGAVGQRFVELLSNNPWFEITALAASERSEGKSYAEACDWRISGEMPDAVRDMMVQPCEPPLDCQIVFSALPPAAAQSVEEQFAAAGYGVFSNASAHRMDPDVPLLIPEVNAEHLALVPVQQRRRGWERGFIVTDPNCATVGMVVPLKPLHDAFGVQRVVVTTMQALSGAGYPGVPSLDILDNVVPYIRNEEDKLISEPRKLLGTLVGEQVVMADMRISPSCNRVATRDGHLETLAIEFARKPRSAEEVKEVLRSFRSEPFALGCPSAVEQTIIVREEPDRPQTLKDRDAGHGMAVTVGRVRPCEVLDWKMVVLSHNTIRGAAGGSILNAEIMVARGMIG